MLASLGKCKWQLYWKAKAEELTRSVADGKLDIVYYGIPGLTSILGVQLHGELIDSNLQFNKKKVDFCKKMLFLLEIRMYVVFYS